MFRHLAIIPTIVLAVPAYAADWAAYDKAAFDTLVAQGKPVVVHVHADWCPTCKKQLSLFPAILPKLGGVATVRVNFDTETGFKSTHRVTNQSTIIVFKGGKEVARGVGTTDAAALETLMLKAK